MKNSTHDDSDVSTQLAAAPKFKPLQEFTEGDIVQLELLCEEKRDAMIKLRDGTSNPKLRDAYQDVVEVYNSLYKKIKKL